MNTQRYEDNIVEQVAAANDIVEIITQYIPLKRAGKNFKACCPFHQEKTPSFMVQPEKQLFHCFGCNAGGDVFSFLMRHENITFPEALRILAERAHIPLPEHRTNKAEDSQKEKIYEIYQCAADYYQELLRRESGKQARSYLAGRKVSDQIVQEFKLGWAPGEWRTLFDHLTKKGYPETLLKQAALIQQSPKGNYYDTFRGRLIFPIFNLQNKIVAFGGRLIAGTEGPKYLNSPETPIFSKRRELFGLNLAKKHIDREWPNLILVEGYMDFLALYQHGFKNAVATLGTALGEDHVRLMKRFVEEVIVVYDGDKAGEAAALRGLEILLEGGMHVKLVSLPKGEDPDDFLKRHGNEAFTKILKNAKDFFDYKLQILLARYPRQDTLGLAKISREMLETFSKVKNPVLLSEYFKRLARALRIDENSLRAEYAQFKKKTEGYRDRMPEKPVPMEPKAYGQEEIMLLVLMSENAPLREKGCLELEEKDFKALISQNLFKLLKKANEQDKRISFTGFLSKIEDEKYREQLVGVMAMLDDAEEKEKIFTDCLRQIKKKRLSERLVELRRLIAEAEQKSNEKQVNLYTQEYQKLLKVSRES